MKKTLLIILLLLSSFVYADIEIDDIRIYVEDEKVSGVDKDGGTIDVLPGDQLEIVVDLDNNINNETDAWLKAVLEDIDDGEDIEKTQDWYTIEANNDKSKTLTFIIPDNTREDVFDLKLNIHYRYTNDTEDEFDRIDFDVDVGEKNEEKDLNLKSSFDNLTTLCGSMVNTIYGCFGYINTSEELRDDLSSCAEERGEYKHQKEDCADDLAAKADDFNSEKARVADLESQVQLKDNQMATMLTQAACNNITETRVREAEKEKQNTFAFIGIAVLGGWWYWNSKKKKASVYDTVYTEKNF